MPTLIVGAIWRSAEPATDVSTRTRQGSTRGKSRIELAAQFGLAAGIGCACIQKGHGNAPSGVVAPGCTNSGYPVVPGLFGSGRDVGVIGSRDAGIATYATTRITALALFVVTVPHGFHVAYFRQTAQFFNDAQAAHFDVNDGQHTFFTKRHQVFGCDGFTWILPIGFGNDVIDQCFSYLLPFFLLDIDLVQALVQVLFVGGLVANAHDGIAEQVGAPHGLGIHHAPFKFLVFVEQAQGLLVDLLPGLGLEARVVVGGSVVQV